MGAGELPIRYTKYKPPRTYGLGAKALGVVGIVVFSLGCLAAVFGSLVWVLVNIGEDFEEDNVDIRLGSVVAEFDPAAEDWFDDVDSGRPPNVVSEPVVLAAYWPDDPEMGVWYQLAERVFHCESILQGADTDAIQYHQTGRPEGSIGARWRGGRIVVDDGYDRLLVGLARRTETGRIELSDDGTRIYSYWDPFPRAKSSPDAVCD